MDALEAIGEINRRRIVELVVDSERSAGDIAAQFTTSRAAISQHLRVLVDAGVLRARREGRVRWYSLNSAALQEVENWLEVQRRRWDNALNQLEIEMAKDHHEEQS